MQAFAQWLASTPVSQGIQKALWLIPILQAIHIMGIAMVLAAVAMVDLRILGLAGRSQTMGETARRFVPWLWTGLAVLATTGIVLVIGEPTRSLLNLAFQIKMALLACAVAVTLVFQASLRRNMPMWEDGRRNAVKVLAAFTFLVWCAIAVAGRWIAYVQVA